MPKILHTADWHWGAPGVHPFYTPYIIPKIVKAAQKHDCQYILVVGDVFDKPKPDQKLKDELARQLLNYKDYPFTFIFCVGNHDYTTKAMDYHSLHYLRHLIFAANGNINIVLLEPGEEYKDEDIMICALENVEQQWVTAAGITVPIIYAWHGTYPGLDFRNLTKSAKTVEKRINKSLKKSGAQYLALGDIHKRLCLSTGKAYYPGPPVQKTYSDESGYIIYDTDEKTVYGGDLRLPQKFNLYFPDYDVTKSTEDEIVKQVKKEVPKGSFVKLRFELPLSSWASINHTAIKEHLENHCTEVRFDNNPVPENRTRKVAKIMAKAKSIEEEIEIGIEDSDVEVNKTTLKKLCLKYL